MQNYKITIALLMRLMGKKIMKMYHNLWSQKNSNQYKLSICHTSIILLKINRIRINYPSLRKNKDKSSKEYSKNNFSLFCINQSYTCERERDGLK